MSLWVWFAAGVLLLIVLLLASNLRFETDLSEREGVLRLRWGANSLVLTTPQGELSWWLYGWRVMRKPLTFARPKPEQAEVSADISLRRVRQERQRFVRLWTYFRRTLQVERFEINARLATPDPVWTARLYGAVSSILYPLKGLVPGARVHVQADFTHELPSGSLRLAVKARVLRLVVLGIKAFQLIRTLRRRP